MNFNLSTNYHLTGLFIHLLQLNGNKLSNGHNNDKKGHKAGLQITAGQWTISGKKKALSCQILGCTRLFFLSCMLAMEKLNSEHQILIILRLDIIGVLGEKTGKERYC